MTNWRVRGPRVVRRLRNVRADRAITRKALAASGLIFYDPWVDTIVGEAFRTSHLNMITPRRNSRGRQRDPRQDERWRCEPGFDPEAPASVPVWQGTPRRCRGGITSPSVTPPRS